MLYKVPSFLLTHQQSIEFYTNFALQDKEAGETMTSTQAPDAIILKGRIGSKTVYGHDRDLSADGDFGRGKIDGTESYYIVYSTPQYGDGQCAQSVVVESQI